MLFDLNAVEPRAKHSFWPFDRAHSSTDTGRCRGCCPGLHRLCEYWDLAQTMQYFSHVMNSSLSDKMREVSALCQPLICNTSFALILCHLVPLLCCSTWGHTEAYKLMCWGTYAELKMSHRKFLLLLFFCINKNLNQNLKLNQHIWILPLALCFDCEGSTPKGDRAARVQL